MLCIMSMIISDWPCLVVSGRWQSVAELATGWKSSGNLSDTVPQGGYEKLLAAYR